MFQRGALHLMSEESNRKYDLNPFNSINGLRCGLHGYTGMPELASSLVTTSSTKSFYEKSLYNLGGSVDPDGRHWCLTYFKYGGAQACAYVLNTKMLHITRHGYYPQTCECKKPREGTMHINNMPGSINKIAGPLSRIFLFVSLELCPAIQHSQLFNMVLQY
uniref:Uncharacterized protein n=1 Tax=Sphaerodactylus townsendi TaxID=933632 RepID=A0ACB8FMP1_9SAUR